MEKEGYSGLNYEPFQHVGFQVGDEGSWRDGGGVMSWAA